MSARHFFGDVLDGFDGKEIVIPSKQQIADQVGQITARHVRGRTIKTLSLTPGFVVPSSDDNRIEPLLGKISRGREHQRGDKPS